MRNSLRVLALLTGLGLALAYPAEARAEVALPTPTCGAAFVPDGRGVPANVPALVATANNPSDLETVTYKGNSPLEDPNWFGSFTASPDPRARGSMLFVPSEPFPLGESVSLEFAMKCDSLNLTGGARVNFKATAPAPLPTTLGTVEQEDTHLVVTPSADLAPFLPVAMIEMRNRGRTFLLESYGLEPKPDGRVTLYNTYDSAYGWCAKGEVSEKKEPIELIVHVAGASEDPPPVPFELRVVCTTSRSIPPRDAGPDTETTVRDDAGGCAAAPNAPASVWASFAIGAALVVASRRKRR